MNYTKLFLSTLFMLSSSLLAHEQGHDKEEKETSKQKDKQVDAALEHRHDENVDAHLDTTFAKEHEHPFLDDSQFKLQWRSYYLDRNTEFINDKEAFVSGGTLGWKSGYYEDTLQLGYTHGLSQKVYGESSRDGTGLLQDGQHSYEGLMEAYANIKLDDTKFTVGRFYFNAPYINKHDIRQLPNSFQAARVITDVNDDLTFGAAYVSHMKDRTSTGFDRMYSRVKDENGKALNDSDGVIVTGARYEYGKSYDSFGLMAFFAPDLLNMYYAENKYRLYEFSEEESVDVDLQYTYQKSAGDELAGDFRSEHYGARTKWRREYFSPHLVYTYYSNDDQILNPWGAVPGYTSIIVQDFYRPGEKTLMAGFSMDGVDYGLEGWSTFVNYAYGDTPDSGKNASPDQQEFDVTVDYRFPKHIFEGLWVRTRYAHINQENSGDSSGAADMDDFRIIINYDYEF